VADFLAKDASDASLLIERYTRVARAHHVTLDKRQCVGCVFGAEILGFLQGRDPAPRRDRVPSANKGGNRAYRRY